MTEGESRAKERRGDSSWLQTLIVVASLGAFMFLLNSQLAELREIVGDLRERMVAVEVELRGVGARLDGVETRLDGMDARLNGMDARLDGMDARLDDMDARLARIEVKVGVSPEESLAQVQMPWHPQRNSTLPCGQSPLHL